MGDKLERLTKLLGRVEKNTTVGVDEDGWIAIDHVESKFPQLLPLLDVLLITEKGRLNISTMDILSKAGYRVTSHETDGFGELSAIVWTKKGKLLVV
jgi:ATP phosphoribosyltransferase